MTYVTKSIACLGPPKQIQLERLVRSHPNSKHRYTNCVPNLEFHSLTVYGYSFDLEINPMRERESEMEYIECVYVCAVPHSCEIRSIGVLSKSQEQTAFPHGYRERRTGEREKHTHMNAQKRSQLQSIVSQILSWKQAEYIQ